MDEPVMANCGERISLERVKRSWTQEQLAERAGMSTRTVQRIESGHEPSLATMRLLAEALGIAVEELSGLGRRLHFPALWSKRLKVTTTAFIAFLVGVAVLVPWLGGFYASKQEGLTALVILVPLGILVFCMLMSVGGYSVQGGKLLIHRMGWSTRYALRDLSEVNVLPNAMMGSMKVCGSEGLFGSIGFFRNGILGLYRAYVTDKEKTLVLGFGTKRVVVSPDNPEEMKRAVEAAVKELVSVGG